MKADAKSRTSYGFEGRLSMIQPLKELLARTERDQITRDWILREMGILEKGCCNKATPPEISRVRRLVSFAMKKICEEDPTWRPYGSRHNPQWIRVRS